MNDYVDEQKFIHLCVRSWIVNEIIRPLYSIISGSSSLGTWTGLLDLCAIKTSDYEQE